MTTDDSILPVPARPLWTRGTDWMARVFGRPRSAVQSPGVAPGLPTAVFEAMPDPILVIAGGDAEDLSSRRIVQANAAARQLLRLPVDGGPLVAAIRDPQVLEAVDEALFGQVDRDTPWAAAGAQARHWRALTRPLPPSKGAMALLVLRDETEIRRMELMRVDFLANASHELKTPLASLSGFIETLKGHARDDEKARDRFLDIMAVQAQRMTRLVADLLSLSRIELNEHIAPSGKVDLVAASGDVADATALLAERKGVTVTVPPVSAKVRVRGDRDEILQVIQNLVDNALRYSPENGTIVVEVVPTVSIEEVATPWAGGSRGQGATRLPLLTPDRAPDVTYTAVRVRDQGPGLAREHLPRLTERFYRVEGQKSGDGTGLGLAIVKHIINRHRGGLTVESEPGHGAIFTAYFPAETDFDGPAAAPLTA